MPVDDMNDIESRAKAGEADAQYALAAHHSHSRRPEEARRWLEMAAAGGHPDALFTLSAARLSGVGGLGVDLPGAVEGLAAAKERGSAAALRMLAALTAAGLAGEGGWDEALTMMRAACAARDPAALREIAALAFDAGGCDADAAAMLATAAKSDALAGALLQRRKHRNPADAPPTVSYDLERVFDRLGAAPHHPQRQDILERPRVASYAAAVSVDLCDHLIGAALPRLQRQEIVDEAGVAHAHPHRTSTGAVLGFSHFDLPAVCAGRIMARLAEAPYENGESLMVLRYRPGEEYRPHHDFLGPNEPDLKTRGQRFRTALLYLNDGYEGGETHFLSPDVKVAGKTGDVVVFDNVDEKGAPDVSARHAGRPVKRGEKWLATLWLRDRPYLR
ncbi:MAG: 2OG-Fe(II) oxygenase [Parvularculaceae bacterium]